MTDAGQRAPAPKAERAALSRDLAEFLIELSISLNRYAMYPGDHPSLRPSAENLVVHLENLLQDRAQLSLGVARSQLVIEGVATDAKNPVLHELAGRLHRHHLGAVTFRQGVMADEIEEVLRLVAVEADRGVEPLGLSPTIRLAAWPHVQLYPLTYDRLELVDDETGASAEDPNARSARTRAAQLWVGLARAAMAGEHTREGTGGGGGGRGEGIGAGGSGDDDGKGEVAEASAVAQAISSHGKDSAYDQVIVGYMLQIADELKAGGGGEAAVLKRRVSKMVSTLDANALGRLLEMGGDRNQRRQFILTASQGMAVDAVLDLVKSASAQDGQTVSHSMLRMLQKLARHSQTGDNTRRTMAESSVRDQVAELIRDWSLADPNPDAYRLALQSMSSSAPVFASSDHVRYLPEPKRLLEMALEVDAMGDPIAKAVQSLLDSGKLKSVVETLESAAASPKVKEGVWALLATPQTLMELVVPDAVDGPLLQLVAQRLGAAAVEPMLDALAESESRQKRRLLLDTITSLGAAVVPAVAARLNDHRWFVQRNMLAILTAIPELPEGFDVGAYMEHEEPRVRREAYRILVRNPATRERAVSRALTDAEERNVRLGLTAVLEGGFPPAMFSLVVTKALQGESAEQRTLAIKALGASGLPMAVNALLRVVAPRKSLLGSRMPPKSPELLAALNGLKRYRKQDQRADDALNEAVLQSKDPDIVRAATGDGEGK